ncbi:MAG: arginine--tRNA ligase [Christensenellales bacterium]
MDVRGIISDLVAEALRAAFPQADLPAAAIAPLLELPPDPKMGDFAFPCFQLSKSLRLGPPQIAQKLAAAIDHTEIARAQVAGGYLNFFLAREPFARETLGAIGAAGDRWGAGGEGRGRTVCLDYSSINIAKRFHIGHLSTTAIGHSLRRIYDFLGWQTVGINHLGDWGTQFGKMIAAYRHWGSREAVEQGGVQALSDLYVRFHQEAQGDPSLEDEGRQWFKRIEDGDGEALAIFNWFKALTLKDAGRVYDILGVSFDSYAGESFYNDKMGRVVDELRAKGLLVASDGAWVVDLEAWGMPPCLILKSDGATLYATRDIAAALYRKDTYGFHKSLYVVAYQQDLHFRQVFKVLELMGYDWARDQLQHVSFGMISYEGEALSTRKGNTVYLDELLARAQEKALAIIDEKTPGLEDKEEIARQVGVGAVIFSDLYNSRIKDIDFRWDRALNFEGETGPYVQYTHARCCSLLRKAGGLQAAPDFGALVDDEALALLKLLALFPEAVREAAGRNEPSVVTRAVTEIAKAYNKYYYEHRILGEDEAGTAARLLLTSATQGVIKTGLYLIGLQAPRQM